MYQEIDFPIVLIDEAAMCTEVSGVRLGFE